MREITAAAARAGAFGVSTSRTTSHRSLNGEFIPTLRAYQEELQELALGVRDGGRGLLEVVTEWIPPNPAEEFGMLCRIAERSGRPVLYSLTQYHEQPDDYRVILGLNRQAAARGVPIRPVVAPRAIGGAARPAGQPDAVLRLPHLPGAGRPAAARPRGQTARPRGARRHPGGGPGQGQHLPPAAFEPPRVEHDLPAGGSRLMQGARGYRCTVVAGRVTWRDGQPTGVLPGKLVRGMRVAAATVDKGG